ncbi:hypothetical protein [Streptomyces sp. NPDC059009]|uniref:hypothetical protein n=1 Tax=Streptomyces sp. NPDC059009 TaxID=3346694 RepID=UPI0036A54F6E
MNQSEPCRPAFPKGGEYLLPLRRKATLAEALDRCASKVPVVACDTCDRLSPRGLSLSHPIRPSYFRGKFRSLPLCALDGSLGRHGVLALTSGLHWPMGDCSRTKGAPAEFTPPFIAPLSGASRIRQGGIVTSSDIEVEQKQRVADSLQFIEGLELELPEMSYFPAGMALQAEEESAAVVAGSIVAFTDGLNGQQKSDVLNSTLLAQLAANKKFDREKDTARWYGFYRSVLEQVGWVVPSFSFARLSAAGSRFTVDRAAIALLQAIATGREVAVAKAAIAALNALTDRDRRVVLFESSSHSANLGNFQIAACGVSAGDTVVMKIGAFHFQTNERVTRVLFFSFPRASTTMYQAGQTLVLNEDVYAQVRAAVIAKLGDKANQFIDELEI